MLVYFFLSVVTPVLKTQPNHFEVFGTQWISRLFPLEGTIYNIVNTTGVALFWDPMDIRIVIVSRLEKSNLHGFELNRPPSKGPNRCYK